VIDIGEPDQIELALLTHVLEQKQLLLERYRVVAAGSRQAQVDEVQAIRAKRTEIRLHPFTQLVRPLRGQDPACVVAPPTDFRDELEVVWIRIQRLADQIVHDIRPVVLRRVDVVDPELDRPAQHGASRGRVVRRAEDTLTRELHRPEPRAIDPLVAERCRPIHRV
jgi:hypothetical protein